MILPNQLTILRIALIPVIFFSMLAERLYFHHIAFLIFVGAALTDAYDGYVARKYGYVTRWGEFLDPLADKLLVGAALAAIAISGYAPWWMVVVIVARDAAMTAVRSYALVRGKSFPTSTVAKWKTSVQLGVVIMVLLYINLSENAFGFSLPEGVRVRFEDHGILYQALLVVTLLTVYSATHYLVGLRAHVRRAAVGLYRAFLSL